MNHPACRKKRGIYSKRDAKRKKFEEQEKYSVARREKTGKLRQVGKREARGPKTEACLN